jgi:hypothetical protein
MPGPVKTRSGRTLSEGEIDRLAARVEKGLDLSGWKTRRGRPPLDAAADEHAPRIAVRVPREVHTRVVARATSEGRTISEVVRDLLERYARGVAAPKT